LTDQELLQQSTEPDTTSRMVRGGTFSHALEAMRKGIGVARSGWREGAFVNIAPHGDAFDLKQEGSKSFAVWIPSVEDILANDWVVRHTHGAKHP
jgi:hypothetical protein